MRYRAGVIGDLFWRRPAAGIVRSQLTISGVFRPAVGDFDGNGIDDIFWYGPGSHYDRVWYGVGGGQFDSRVIDIPEQGFPHRSEEHTSELQSLMRISYAVFCLKQKKQIQQSNST